MADPVPIRTDAAEVLALVVVAASNSPLVLLDGQLNVVAASGSFCGAFGIEPAAAPGRALSDLGDGEWNVPQLRNLLKATLRGDADILAYEMDLVRQNKPPRSLILNVQKLEYGDDANVRLLMAVQDVTASRNDEKRKDDLLRETTTQLRELQHRIANSLQIIASILMQSARRVNSHETRDHLYDARDRVLSVDALQQRLAASRVGDVPLRGYFTDLADSIGASMIRDHHRVSIVVTVDDSVTGADISVSLGLLVTELVINALKHAFPGRRRGAITIAYGSRPTGWVLSVGDDGVGMARDAIGAKSGLGTIIIESLAKQLHAVVRVADAHPGLLTTITGPIAVSAFADAHLSPPPLARRQREVVAPEGSDPPCWFSQLPTDP